MDWRQGEGAGGGVPQDRPGSDGGGIDIWSDGEQTGSFLHVDECLEGTLRLMALCSPSQPLNAGLEPTYAWIERQALGNAQRLREAA
jgi:hypothetical protein